MSLLSKIKEAIDKDYAVSVGRYGYNQIFIAVHSGGLAEDVVSSTSVIPNDGHLDRLEDIIDFEMKRVATKLQERKASQDESNNSK